MENMQYIGDNPVDNEKIMSAAGMAALMEEHADYWGGAGRLAELLDYITDAHTWNRYGEMLSLDMLNGVT